MKLTTLLLLVALLQVRANGYSQINLHETDAPLKKVLQSIEKQTGYVFLYTDHSLENAAVTIEVKNASIDEVLEKCFKGLPYSFKIVEKNILLREKEKTLAEKITKLMEFSVTVPGIVTDEDGKGIQGVNIQLKGSAINWVTGRDGKFILTLNHEKEAVLIFSYVGYKTREIPLKGSMSLAVKMEYDPAKLDQITIIGYGTSTKRFNTGSTAEVDSKTLDKMPINDPILELQGRAPGVQITPTSGLPGSEVNVQIRGVNSLNRASGSGNPIDRSNSPLYVVDGVPFVSSPLNADGVGANMGVYEPSSYGLIFSSPFKSINPQDIESIVILKDADATAIYGARGANGVILITTKRPKAGNTTLNADVYHGVGQVPKFVHMLNTKEYLAMRREAYQNDGLTPSSDPNSFLAYAPDLTIWDTTAYTNWQKKYAGGSAATTNAQATVSGGNDQTRFLFNVGYREQGTVFAGNFGLQQGSFRLNVDHNSLDKKFTMNISTMYSTDINKLVGTDPYSYYSLPPNQPIYNTDGSLNWTAGDNPEAYQLQTYRDRAKNMNSSIVLGYQVLKNLHFKTNLGYSRLQQDQEKETPIGSFSPGNTNKGSRNQATNISSTFLVEPQFDYNLKLGEGSLQALLGGTYQKTSASSLFLDGEGYTNDDLLGDIGSATTIYTKTTASDYKYLSFFSRLNYNLKNKYILNLTGRRDGSSRFGPGKRYGNFGAAGAAWIFSEEPWMDFSHPFLSFGKLRGSYGITGNDKIGDYQYYNTYQAASLAPYQTVGYISNKLYNPEYQWETNKKIEGAIELGFLNDRISLTADYYNNRTGNSLVSYPLPSQTGFTGVTANLNAKIENSGFEFSLSTVNIKNKDFSWNTNFNVSFQRNKLLSFPGLASSPYRDLYSIGQSISNIHGFVFDGVDSTGAAKLKDLNKNGIFNEFGVQGDQTIIANSLPSFYGGISNTFIYKNWQLDIFFNFRKLNKVAYNPNPFPGAQENIDHSTGARWQHPGDITNTPRYAASILTGNFSLNQAFYQYLFLATSDYTLRNGSYLRLSNVNLSYTVPPKILKQVNIKYVRVYLSGQNLFNISHFPGPDPETGLSMPSLRTVAGGLKITL